ncbi:class I SAM-dependent methyltransferase [Oceanibacterium hippocampi]|uniref:Ubiquinone/menaquinone biosynthesis methyltransferase n=1 Tax=Oceanibacterium hippocampi TaxID=745714 RepID=A0A1Y5SGD3_9PROT|nr:class I SAM-dependent methyltransferase [Oceanibacterium hippocampi]SLN38460.1 ubiquinone/menaquinone biosynthesis methyltransferase [Oceanibacterium hippocampi]
MIRVEWDYTDLAAAYDKRADYSDQALDRMLRAMALAPGRPVADLGAGTGKLTVPLARRGYRVFAVEPNDAMRGFGIRNSEGFGVQWSQGTGEATGLGDAGVQAVFFGSSFNVVDQQAALDETLRILTPGGWFACMWNHRDLDEPLQVAVEEVIRRFAHSYDYGERRRDPSGHVESHGGFHPVQHVEGRFDVTMPAAEWVEAWRSHATLARQTGGRFDEAISAIGGIVAGRELVTVPYATRIWFARAR